MQIIIPLIVAFLMYRIKLIDDRKSINFERLKKYLQREGLMEKKNDVLEHEAWLDKDVRFELWHQYLKNKKDEGKKQAILDFYKDFKDNENKRIEIFVLIVVNILYLMLKCYLQKFLDIDAFFYTLFEFILIISSISLCMISSQHSLFNNRILNPEKSKKIKKIYEHVQEEIELDLNIIRKKYNLENHD